MATLKVLFNTSFIWDIFRVLESMKHLAIQFSLNKEIKLKIVLT